MPNAAQTTTLSQDDLKRQVSHAALQYVPSGQMIGVGTGSTADMFIDALAAMKDQIPGAVASSERSAARLAQHGIKVVDLNEVQSLAVYIDGADEIDASFAMIKGGGGALTREKIVASVAKQFICIADASKLVDVMGKFPLPVEVVPMASAAIARQLAALGGRPVLRLNKDGSVYLTDNQCQILDVHGLSITQPRELEATINHWPGVVTNGLFALRSADVVLLGTQEGVRTLKK